MTGYNPHRFLQPERHPMTIASMTGFGRAEASHGPWRWHWELKSVNSRGLDLRLRTPPGLDILETRLRDSLKERLSRGSVQASLTLDRAGVEAAPRVNAALVQQLFEDLSALARRLGTPPPSFDTIVGLRGVIEIADPDTDESDMDARLDAIAASFSEALDSLCAARAGEGGKLTVILEAILREIETLMVQAAALAATAPETLRSRLEEQVSALLADRADMPPERIAQEVALLAAKADIREELDRLGAHLAQARELMASGKPCGRKLDFLAQEFNREANTLCSKSSDTDLTRIGLDLKAAIDQLREQVQNVE